MAHLYFHFVSTDVLSELPLVECEHLLSAESGGPSMLLQAPSDNFNLTNFSTYFMDVDSMVPPPGEEGFSSAVSLLHNGCIGSSPTCQTVAITIRTLDVFQQSHRVCQRFSIHTAMKMLCFMHNLCYYWHLAEQMCTAFNVYLEIHSCQYKLVNEPTLDFLILCACDRNNSAKLVDPAVCSGEECLDPCSGLSSIWLTELYVDQLKDEVRSVQAYKLDLNDSAEPPTICINHWHNAVPESHKKMFAILKKSGIFVTVCQHSFLLTICDMVQSSKLMKYLIASVKKLMDVFGSNILYGYDIKCTFKKIIQWSLLADDAKPLNLQGVVPAFHGHAHNRLCQVKHHLKYKVSAGEDFETCKQVFSESNAPPYVCHIIFADSTLTMNIADFIYNNHIQVLTIISTTNIFLANFHTSNATIKPNFEDDLKDEHQVLQCLACKKEESTVEVDYVRALNEYDKAHGLNLCLNYSTKESGDIHHHHSNATNKHDQKLEIVTYYEHQMVLDSRWGPDHPKQMKTQSCITNQLFHKAVDDIEHLVVMHLLELTKLQMSGLGYKLHTQISKALKSHVNAIQNALTQYNKYGTLLSPSHPPLQWDQIFDLLWEMDGEIQSKKIHWLNVELGCLLMKMQDDAINYSHAIAQLQSSDPPLAAKLQHCWT
ncbi:uncharacterized protein BJ212DRAFT_1448891 [Suillus subaureus]|uniref:CxC2-like cysteine cluster KDZ transposase-associated domain-containing protein n=1 Tax=Suillus subaureus TaxID=48587 RepID=A0A9P7E1H7_9AGAM|nr:uncharacterized protein BJ212DRAFT_1448891 [Suillus subaureus]KAG1808894.1 hypothetical protein BJ212DRAFT_1448891 [Suillus subaureus]